MNAKQLQLEDGTKVEAFRCGECGLIYSEHTPYSAERCCVCQDCGASTHKEHGGARSHLCQKCWGPHYAKLDADRLERATEIPDYAGPVVIDGDRYFQTMDDLLEHLEEDGDERPEFVHTCHIHSYSLDAESILQDLLENSGVEEIGRAHV